MTLEERLKETEAKLAAAEAELERLNERCHQDVLEAAEAVTKERECNKVLREALVDMAWLDNPNEIKYISHPTCEYMRKSREALAKEQEMRK